MHPNKEIKVRTTCRHWYSLIIIWVRDLVVSLDSKSLNLLRYLPGPVYLFLTGSCCVAQADLKLEAIVLPKPLEYP